jgi:hypothetical protein
MFVFIFMYFVSRSPFILDLLCLVYYDGVSVCVCILLSCTFITFYFRSRVSWGLWVPMFVFIFLYFASRSPFILDLLCLGYWGFLCFVFIFLYFASRSPFILDLLCLVYYEFLCFVFIFMYFVSRSPFILDLLCLGYYGFLCLCLYSCILYLDHLLF